MCGRRPALRYAPVVRPASAGVRARPTVAGAQIRRMRQEFGLTRREQEVVELLGAGHSNAAIARRLLLTEKTVKNHLNHIFAKLRVTNRTEAVVRWSGPDGTPIR